MFQVLLGEVNAGLKTTQVVVKELKASASVQDQMHFLEEAQPYRYTFTSRCPELYRSHFVRIVFNFSSTVPHMEILIHTWRYEDNG